MSEMPIRVKVQDSASQVVYTLLPTPSKQA